MSDNKMTFTLKVKLPETMAISELLGMAYPSLFDGALHLQGKLNLFAPPMRLAKPILTVSGEKFMEGQNVCSRTK